VREGSADDGARGVVAGWHDDAGGAQAAGGQLVALGELESLADIRRVIRASEELTTYLPRAGDAWDEAYATFTRLVTADRSRQGLGV
jgi:hypothetical protein